MCSYKKRRVLTLFPVQKTLGIVHGLLIEPTHMDTTSSFNWRNSHLWRWAEMVHSFHQCPFCIQHVRLHFVRWQDVWSVNYAAKYMGFIKEDLPSSWCTPIAEASSKLLQARLGPRWPWGGVLAAPQDSCQAGAVCSPQETKREVSNTI